MIKKQILDSKSSSTSTSNMQPVYQRTQSMMVNPFDLLMNELADVKMMLQKLLLVEKKEEIQSDLINIQDASVMLCMSKSSVYKMTSTDTIPHFKREGSSRLIFSRKDLDSWMRESQPTKIASVDDYLHGIGLRAK